MKRSTRLEVLHCTSEGKTASFGQQDPSALLSAFSPGSATVLDTWHGTQSTLNKCLLRLTEKTRDCDPASPTQLGLEKGEESKVQSGLHKAMWLGRR
ncbi:hypothetical protein VULLAG_LOCUS22474 [Vulpes lagopus]